MLRVDHASRIFGAGRGRCVAVDDCSIQVEPGETVGVIGPNGAGKTTLLRMIAGDLALSRGTAAIGGHSCQSRRGRRLIGFASDPPLALPELTGLEWLKYLATHRARTPGERTKLVQWAIELGELEEFVTRPTGTLSRGMAQRLALGAAAILGTSLVVLDEVLSGVDPIIRRRSCQQIAALASAGRAVIMSSHDLPSVERLARRVIILNRGCICADVNMADLTSERIVELTLSGTGFARAEKLLSRFPGATRTGAGVEIPLRLGLTAEEVMVESRRFRIPVVASRIRYRALEDLLAETQKLTS